MKAASLPIYSVLSFIAFFCICFRLSVSDVMVYISTATALWFKLSTTAHKVTKGPKKVKEEMLCLKASSSPRARWKDRRKKKECTSFGNYEYLDSWLSLFSPSKLSEQTLLNGNPLAKKITLSWTLCLWGKKKNFIRGGVWYILFTIKITIIYLPRGIG